MILANLRTQLRANDLRVMVVALARGDAARRARYERLLLEAGPDALLDDPQLLPALLAVRSLIVPSAVLFTYVVVRHTLLAAHVDDRELADYLGTLFLEFSDHGRHARVRKSDDVSYRYLVDILADLSGLEENGERGFLLQTHLGNYSLWLAGLFPDYVAARRNAAGGPDLPYYDELGRHGYDLAARHPLAQHLGMVAIFRAAADRFTALRVAFNRMSDRFIFPDTVTPEKILRTL